MSAIRIARSPGLRCPERVARTGAIALLLLAGCLPESAPPSQRVDQAWRTAADEPPPAAEPATAEARPPPVPENDKIATANGRPISRRQIVNLLLAGHGPGVLEQVVVLQEAMQLAAAQNLVVSEADIEREYDRAVEQLAAGQPDSDPAILKRQAGESILTDILSRRNISRAEFDMAMKRNAYLRKIVLDRFAFTQQQLRDEFDRVYGERVVVRLIQVSTLSEAEEVRRRLTAGFDFAEVARQMSGHAATARDGGRLAPFTRTDPEIPSVMRDVAFGLADGAISNPVRFGDTYQILQRERLIPAQDADFERERPAMAQRLRDRAVGPAMQQLYRELYGRADITVYDPVLRAAVEQRTEQRTMPDTPNDARVNRGP